MRDEGTREVIESDWPRRAALLFARARNRGNDDAVEEWKLVTDAAA